VRRIVEEKFVADTRTAHTVLTQAAQKGRIIPFVCDYDIRVSEHSIEIDA